MKRRLQRAWHTIPSVAFTVVVAYLVYAVAVPFSFYSVRKTTMSCPITRTTIISLGDGNFRINSAEPRCNYAAARVPEPVRGGDNLSFLDLKNEVWGNDSLNCEVFWREYPRLPFALKPPAGDARLDRASCRLSSQT